MANSFQENSAAFRQYLPDLNTPRFQRAHDQNCYEYAQYFQDNRAPPWLHDLTQTWQKLLDEPYKGLTVDGSINPTLFTPRPESLPTPSIFSAAQHLLSTLSPPQQSQLIQPLPSKAWRSWSNPEVLLRPLGLRLEELSAPSVAAIKAVLQATLSPEGYTKATAAMRINGFLGELCALPAIMNAGSYNFLMFGEPSPEQAARGWGWSLYGHHLCLNVFVRGTQVVVSPTFIGAEPNVVDSGPYAGTEILREEGEGGLGLMRSLPREVQARARVYRELKDPGMRITGDLVGDRWNPDDQRHVCGAFRDNRVLPVREGVCAREFGEGQKEALVRVVEEFIIYLPEESRRLKLEDVRRHMDETWFSWIGGWGEEDAFYYRVQSPVIVVEFDHHSGVFLTNKEPKRFHIHSIVRTPNGGDYGNALRDEGDKVE